MARAIDAGAVKRRAWDIAEAWKDQGRDYEALLLESVVEQIVDTQPTLTPPNEPLTIEQLREMGGQPYWHVGLREESSPPHWNILDPFYAKHIEDYRYGENWLAYRRPPEGEEHCYG